MSVNLQAEVDRAARARALLDDPLLQNVLDSLRQNYLDLIENAPEPTTRDHWWYEMQGMKRFVARLTEFIETGKMAQMQLNINKKAN